MLTFATASLVLVAWQQAPSGGTIGPGDVVAGEIDRTAEQVRTDGLERANDFRTRAMVPLPVVGPTRGRSYELKVAEEGEYTIDLRSDWFDAYLVLWGEGGDTQENDNGLVATHARLKAHLRPGGRCRIAACGLRGELGKFELRVTGGQPAEVAEPARLPAEIEEWRRLLAVREKAFGDHDVRLVQVLDGLLASLFQEHRYAEALPLARRELAILERQFGQDSEQAAYGAIQVAAQLHGPGHFEEAVSLLRRSAAIRRNVLGANHPAYARTLNALAALLDKQGRYAEAEDLVRQALAIAERNEDQPEIERSLGNLAWLLQAQDKFDAAASVFTAVIERIRAREGDNLSSAWHINDFGWMRHRQGNDRDAEDLLTEALKIRRARRDPEHPLIAQSLNNLAAVFESTGRYAQAEHAYREGLRIRRARYGEVHAEVAESLGNLAAFLARDGRYGEAEPLAREAAELAARIDGPGSARAANADEALAEVLHAQGRFADAERLLRGVLTIREAIVGPTVETATALNWLGIVLGEQRKNQESAEYLQRALEIRRNRLGPGHAWTLTSVNNLAVLLTDAGEYARAESLLRGAVDAQEQDPKENALAGVLRNDLGLVLDFTGRHAEAEPLLRRALAEIEAARGHGHVSTTVPMNNLGMNLLAQGKAADAEPYLDQALAIWRETCAPGHSRVVLGLGNRTTLLANLGQWDEAAEAAVEYCESSWRHLLGELALSGGQDSYRLAAAHAGAVDCLLTCCARVSDPAALARAYGRVTEWKGVAFRRSRQLAEAEAGEQVPLVARLRDTAAQIAALAGAHRIPDPQQHRARFEALVREQQRLESELLARLGITPAEERTDAAELGQRLPQGSAVLDFVVHRPRRFERFGRGNGADPWDEPRVLCFVIRAGAKGAEVVDLGPQRLLGSLIDGYLEELSRRGARGLAPGADETAKALGLKLWQRLSQHLAAVKQVIVIPDEVVGRLPFEAVRVEGGRFLLEQMDVVYAQDAVTLRDQLASGAPSRAERPSLLALGDVAYGASTPTAADAAAAKANGRGLRGVGRNWGRLEGTRLEIDAVVQRHAHTFGDAAPATVLSGADATEAALTASLRGATVVHLATHGFFERKGIVSRWRAAVNEAHGAGEIADAQFLESRARVKPPLDGEDPDLLAGLILAGANAPGRDEDCVLTAAEARRLDLSACELAVLSACETGLGSAQAGEGLSSLRRAFAAAGARTVISSLWKVDDTATLALMSEVYDNLWVKRQPPWAALRNAKLALLRSERFAHPGCWAAFVLAGDWR
ncbi:MAG: CHAT domain-containing tetratricopeptide repeat protein [Planctomycetota bacterium]